ncbi:3-chlorobenzoate-3,4-dioxygenase oxygenase subunit [Acromyrmex echinatior]|uniref:cholesterol 7-desaturase n=1 Tax=Acromyrmex echinatior TaxID=103372 RepID=F4W8L5_ACREC|nr:3-chlorobenzoate-3,4-dioxygenase oxygenase subunit [Acromyrmex echinatior]
MLEWCVGIATTLLTFLIYFAYFFKFNWVKDMRIEAKTRQTRSFYASNKHRKVGKLPPVYPNGWFALLESSQIKNGQVKHVSALGENFAVFRTERGVVNILDAYCPHLGANMAEGGRVKGNCLECPFHSWTFRGEDGYCENIPYAEKAKKRAELNSVSIHPIENDNGNNHFAVSQNNFGSKEKHKAGLHMCHKLILLERFSIMEIDVLAEQIGPSYVELMINTSIGPMYILQTVTPVEPLLQRVTHQIFSPPLLAPYANLIFLGECLMFERDVKIWNYKKYERQPILVREDRAIQAYRRWYSQFYSDHSPTYETAMKDLQW